MSSQEIPWISNSFQPSVFKNQYKYNNPDSQYIFYQILCTSFIFSIRLKYEFKTQIVEMIQNNNTQNKKTQKDSIFYLIQDYG